jgi:hypothetical protein
MTKKQQKILSKVDMGSLVNYGIIETVNIDLLYSNLR